MNSIFLRIYGGMCAALILVALLGVLALHLLNEVRSGQYRERLAHGTFALMGDNLKPMSPIERQRALAVWERLLGIPSAPWRSGNACSAFPWNCAASATRSWT